MHLSGRGNSECAVKENYGAIVAQKLRNPILDHTHSKIRNPIRDGEMPCLGNSSQYFPRWAEHIVNECQSQKGRPRFAALQVNDSSTRNWVGRLSEAEFHACAGCSEPPIQSRYVSPMRALRGTHTDHEIVKKMEHTPSQLIPRDFAGVDSKKAIVDSTKEYVPKWLKDREEAVSNKEIELKKAWDDYKYRLQDILRREERLKLRELAVVNTAEKHGLAWHCDLVARESQVQIEEELLGERKVQILEELNDFRKNIFQELEVAMKTLSQVINNSTTSLREVNSSQPSEFDGLEKSGSITRAAPTFYDNQSVTKLLTTVILENAPKLASPKRPQQTKANAAMPSQRKENDLSSAVFTNGIDADESLDEEGYEALVRKVDHQISERTKENCDELAILHREENLMLREQQLRALTQYLKKQRADTQEEKLRLQERLARVAVLEERVRNAAAKIRGEVPVISSSQRLHRLLMDQLNRRQEREQQIVGNQSRCDTL